MRRVIRRPILSCAALVCAALASASMSTAARAADTEEQAMYRKAKRLMDQHRLDEARAIFEKAIVAYPNNSLGQYYFAETLARSARGTTDLERAEQLYRSAFKAYPKEEMGLNALAEAEKLGTRRRAIQQEDAKRQAAAETERQRQTKATDARATMLHRRLILDNLGEAERYYIVVRRNLTAAEAAEPGRKEETAYCVWFEEQGFTDDPERGTTLKGLKLFARAANAGQRTVSWAASASWNEDESILRIRPTDTKKRLGIDVARVDGRVVPQPSNWPFPIGYALRKIGEPCAFVVRSN